MLDFSVEQFYLAAWLGTQKKGAYNQSARPVKKQLKTLLSVLYYLNSYADDTTLYSCAEDMSSVITELQRIANKIFRWSESNHVKANPGKRHVLLSSNVQRVVPSNNV